MFSQKLMSIIMSLVTVAIVTMSATQPKSVGGQQPQATAVTTAEETIQTEADGSTPFPTDTTEQTETDVFLDADEVERRAIAEQSGTQITTSSKLPLSFKSVAVPVPGGIDHAVAGVGTRNSGRGVIRLRGVPPGSTLLAAILVWGEIAAAPLPAGAVVTFERNCLARNWPVVFLGATGQPCWNPAGTFFAYAAIVNGAIFPGINGDYLIQNLRSNLLNNRCPWPDVGVAPGANCPGPGNALPLSEGASLVVVYTNPCIPRNAQLYIHVGPRRFTGFQFNNHAVAPNIFPNTTLANFKHSRIGADGQVGIANCGLRAIPAITDERTTVTANLAVPIRGPLPFGFRNRDSDWNGHDGEPLNKLWDSHTDVFQNPCTVNGGCPSYNVNYQSFGDCIVWVMHVLGVR